MLVVLAVVSFQTVSAQYTAVYSSGDISETVIDFLVSIMIGMVNEGDTMGLAIAVTISVGLLLGLVLLLFKFIGKIRATGKGMAS